MEKKTITPIVVVYHGKYKDGSTSTGNKLTSVDRFPVTLEQLTTIKRQILKKNNFCNCVFLNIIPLREEEVQGDE